MNLKLIWRFSVIVWKINEELGVIQLTNDYNYNRLNLKLYESVILLILRILYDEKKRELSVSDEVIVNLGDIQDKYLSLQIREKNDRQNYNAERSEHASQISDY